MKFLAVYVWTDRFSTWRKGHGSIDITTDGGNPTLSVIRETERAIKEHWSLDQVTIINLIPLSEG